MTTTEAPKPTPIPGVTGTHIAAILDGPAEADWRAMPTLLAKALVNRPGLWSDAEKRAANDKIELFFKLGAMQCAAARDVAEGLTKMSDAEKAMITADQMQQVAEQIVGYRNKLVGGGISETAAEHMAMQLHGMLMTMAIQGGQQKS